MNDIGSDALALTRATRTKSPPTAAFMRHIESHAARLRKRAAIGDEEPLDPFATQARLGIKVAYPEEVADLPGGSRRLLAELDAKVWSGMAAPLPCGTLLVILNPNQTRERANVTILEEVAHVHFGHRPTRLVANGAGVPERVYDEAAEQEAYWTAGAALLPGLAVAKRVWRGHTAAEIGATFGASEELAEMRIKTLRLWGAYQSNHERTRMSPGR